MPDLASSRRLLIPETGGADEGISYVMAIADYLAYDWHEIAPAESDVVNPRSALWQGYRQ